MGGGVGGRESAGRTVSRGGGKEKRGDIAYIVDWGECGGGRMKR